MMTGDTLNRTFSIPDLPRRSFGEDTAAIEVPRAGMLYDGHLVDPFEPMREEWLGDEVNSNPLASEEKDVEESRYGAKLGGLAMGLDKEGYDEDEDQSMESPDDEGDHEESEGEYDRST